MMKKIIPSYGTPLNLNNAEDYLFCGALSKTMQTIGCHDFDYWFISGVTGDTFAQVFSRNFDKYYDCLSSATFSKMHLDYIFDTIGYNYSLVSNREFYQSKELFITRIKAWIDKGVPVIVKDTADSWFSLAVGYENDVISKFDMLGIDLQKYNFDISEYSNYALIFVEDKSREFILSEIYRKIIFEVPGLLNRVSTENASFGKQAFLDWAESLLSGRSEFLSDYFDWAGTNAHMTIVLDRAATLNPDMKSLIDKLRVFAEMNSKLFCHKFEAIRAVTDKNEVKLNEISNRIKEMAFFCDEIVAPK